MNGGKRWQIDQSYFLLVLLELLASRHHMLFLLSYAFCLDVTG